LQAQKTGNLDLKLVYATPTEETALNELELFRDK